MWLDNGNDLSESLASWVTSPLRTDSWQINYLPVIQHKHRIALKPRSRLLLPVRRNECDAGKIIQSTSLLHLDHGLNLDRPLAASDAFYALNEVFRFALFSEVQFLNMLESKLIKELDQSVLIQQNNPTLSNLLYNQKLLDRHIQRIQDNITSMEGRALALWPKGLLGEDEQVKANLAAEALLQDYDYLLCRAHTLSEQCNTGMQIVMNNAMIEESREAIFQAEGVAKLTRLACIFIPLSFTTSFFGMNIWQLGTGHLSIWIWIVVSFPIFVIPLIFMQYDLAAVIRRHSPWKAKTVNVSRGKDAPKQTSEV